MGIVAQTKTILGDMKQQLAILGLSENLPSMAAMTGLNLDKEQNEKVFSCQSLVLLGAKLDHFIAEISAF